MIASINLIFVIYFIILMDILFHYLPKRSEPFHQSHIKLCDRRVKYFSLIFVLNDVRPGVEI